MIAQLSLMSSETILVQFRMVFDLCFNVLISIFFRDMFTFVVSAALMNSVRVHRFLININKEQFTYLQNFFSCLAIIFYFVFINFLHETSQECRVKALPFYHGHDLQQTVIHFVVVASAFPEHNMRMERAQVRIYPYFNFAVLIKTDAALVEANNAIDLLHVDQSFESGVKNFQSLGLIQDIHFRQSIGDSLNEEIGLMGVIIGDSANGVDNVLLLQVDPGVNTLIVIDGVGLGNRPEDTVLPDLAMRKPRPIPPHRLLVSELVRMHQYSTVQTIRKLEQLYCLLFLLCQTQRHTLFMPHMFDVSSSTQPFMWGNQDWECWFRNIFASRLFCNYQAKQETKC